MKKTIFISALLISMLTTISLPLPTLAQTPNNNNSEKISNIKKMLAIIGVNQLTKQVLNQLITSMKTQYPEVPAKFWDTFAAELKPEQMIAELIPIYSKYFSNEEIQQIIAFYETPLGKKTLTVLPQISQESAEIGIRYGREASQRALQKLEAQGYLRRP